MSTQPPNWNPGNPQFPQQPQSPQFPQQGYPPNAGQQPPFGGQQPNYGGQQPPFSGQQPPFSGQQPPFSGQQPQFGGPVPPQGPKKTPVWVWVVGALAAVVLVAVVAIGAAGYIAYSKAKTFVAEAEQNPTAALAKLAVAANPDYEYISSDNATGMVKVRQKSDGQVIEISIDQLKEGRISIKTDDGQRVEIGANVDMKAPSWVPVPPGAKMTGVASASVSDADGGSVVLTTEMNGADLKKFYTETLEKNGFTIEQSSLATGGNNQVEGMLQARKDAARQSVTVMFATATDNGESKTTATIIFSEKKEGSPN